MSSRPTKLYCKIKGKYCNFPRTHQNNKWQLLKVVKLRHFLRNVHQKLIKLWRVWFTCIMNWGEYIVITDINTKYRICWGPISPIWEKTWSILSFCFILAILDRRFWVKKLSIVFSRPRSSFASVTSMFQKSKHNRYLSHFAATCKTNCLFFQSFMSTMSLIW